MTVVNYILIQGDKHVTSEGANRPRGQGERRLGMGTVRRLCRSVTLGLICLVWVRRRLLGWLLWVVMLRLRRLLVVVSLRVISPLLLGLVCLFLLLYYRGCLRVIRRGIRDYVVHLLCLLILVRMRRNVLRRMGVFRLVNRVLLMLYLNVRMCLILLILVIVLVLVRLLLMRCIVRRIGDWILDLVIRVLVNLLIFRFCVLRLRCRLLL